MQNHNDTINKQTSEAFFKRYISHFIVTFACERELETEQRLQYIHPHSYGHQHCVFLVLILNRRPGGSAFCWLSLPHLVTNGSPKLLGNPRAPFCWVVGFLYRISSLNRLISNSLGGPGRPLHRAVTFSTTPFLRLLWSPTRWPPVFTELYNSSIAHSIFGMASLVGSKVNIQQIERLNIQQNAKKQNLKTWSWCQDRIIS